MPRRDAVMGLEVDQAVKRRAQAVLRARGMTMSSAVRRMFDVGMLEHRIPFEVTRDPAFGGIGMTDDEAAAYGIDRRSFSLSDMRDAVTVSIPPERKAEIRAWCREMCTNPNNVVHMFIGQVAFELRLPFAD